MFCPKCGNQLPDGAMFCTSCGSQMNTQPAAPVMPAAPINPSEPVTPAEPITPSEPVVPADSTAPSTPVDPTEAFIPQPTVAVEQPIMPQQPSFAPVQPTVNNMAMPATVNPAMAAPVKKSKAPLFIGLGVGALIIAIVAIVLVIVFTGDDNDNDSNKVNGTEAESTTANDEYTTEENTTEEPTTDDVSDIDYDDATDVAEDFMFALEYCSFSNLDELLYPGLISYIEDQSGYDDVEDFFTLVSLEFTGPDGYFLDYEVEDARKDNSNYFFEDSVGDDINNYSDYEEPQAFAMVHVEFSYEAQTTGIDLLLAYTNEQFYIVDYDDSNFYIEVESESESSGEEVTTPTAEEMATLIQSILADTNYNYTLLGGEYDGTETAFNGFTIKLPTGWTPQVNPNNSMTYYHAPNNNTAFAVLIDSTFGTADAVTYLTGFCRGLMSTGFDIANLGNLITPNGNGYYVVGSVNQNGTTIYQYNFLIPDSTGSTVYCFSMNTSEPASDYAYIAEYVAATLTTQ